MQDRPFVHLRLHSEYSIVDGLVRLDEAIGHAVQDMQPAMALTDLANVFGLIKFYKGARKKGVKPIAGCDLWISGENNQPPSRLLVLVKDHQGYLNLCELLTHAWRENQQQGRAEVKRAWLEKLFKEQGDTHLIALSGALSGDIGQALAKQNDTQALACAQAWMAIFPDSFYIEVQRIGEKGEEYYIQHAVELAEKLNLPVVATHPIQFMTPEQYRAHEARICISEGELLDNPNRTHKFTQQQYFQTQHDMNVRFEDLPAAIDNTVEIAKRCNLSLVLGEHKLPLYPTEDGLSLDDYMTREAKRGLEKRLEFLFPDEKERAEKRGPYDERLAYEISTIVKMGFSGYFLIVADFIQWAKDNDVPVGPGRGSGAGSLVAYSLLITDLDPIRYHLIFERFLNPERVSMPDFDVDFCQFKRDRVIKYVKRRYGSDAVSQIATFGTMAAKAAVRDVGRVLDCGYSFSDGVSKLIPFKPGKQVTIADAKKEEPILAEREQSEEKVKKLLDLAEQVEGLTRNIGMHAGGVLIAPGKLTDFCPLYTQGGESGVVSQYDKYDVEAVGLVKFDFLGLTTLTILDLARKYINYQDKDLEADYLQDTKHRGFRLEKIPLDDAPTFELLTKAKTVAVFQLESRGMQGMLKDARPDRFEDIIALVALYRPGPMDLIPDYCRRKHGEAFEYPDDRAKGILAETYGIMIYQEQVMQMAQVIGGYTLGGADLLRRAMGHKDAKEMEEHRQIFREGAAKNGIDEKKADEIFDLMEKFAGYGFNKSHATAYALLSYQTAYLKKHHPAAFLAANMTLAMDDTEKICTMVDDAREVCGLEILPPDINRSDYYFKPEGLSVTPPDIEGENYHIARINASQSVTTELAHQVRFGLGAIKGSGENAMAAIVRAREQGGPFKDIFDFCARVDRHLINRRTIESLIRAGAFDCTGVDRGIVLASLPLAIEAAGQEAASSNQGSLFGEEQSVRENITYVDVPPWDERKRLQEEKGVLGFYLSGHLFNAYRDEVRQVIKTTIDSIAVSRESRWVGGIITAIRTQTTQRGRMMVVTLDDSTGEFDVSIFSELLETKRDLLKEDEYVSIFGRISEDKFTGGLRMTAEDVLDITQTRLHFGRLIQFDLPEKYDLKALANMMQPFVSEQGLPVRVDYICDGTDACAITLGDKWRLAPTDACLAALRTHFNARILLQ